MKLKVVLTSLVFYSQTAQAEVLDKFGGCQSPRYFKWLLLFIIAIGILRFFEKNLVAKLLIFLSLVYIVVDVLWVFLTSKQIIPSWFDQAILGFYTEIQSCPQFENIGYWQQSWLAVAIYLLTLFIIVKLTSRRFD